jgi:Zn-dependent metalloprotease
MRRWLVATGFGAICSFSSCLEVTLTAPLCSDFSTRSARSLPRPDVFLSRPSLRPITARFSPKGEIRSLSGDFVAVGDTFEEASLEFLHSERASLGLSPDLLFQNPIKRHGKAADYVRVEATYKGYKVYQGQAIVALQKEGQDFHVKRLSLRTPTLQLDAPPQNFLKEEAIEIAHQATQTELFSAASTAEMVALPNENGGVWAYQVMVSSETPRGEFEVLIDAQSKEIISLRDTLEYVNGTGLVFDPNPVASTGDTTLTDNNDFASTALNDARVQVTLLELDGTGVLKGPFVDVKNLSSRATDATNTFNFNRFDNRFEEVMAYFHIDRTQRYLRDSLGFTDVNNRTQIAVANAFADDNSFYSRDTQFINYGSGGVDDAEDADIVIHEYGHSIQDDQGMGDGGDLNAMGEGFGDYLAASVGDLFSQEVTDMACIGDWDTSPCLRRIDGPKHFPEARDGEPHDDGEMWSALLFDLRNELGADILDTMLIESQFLIGSSGTFEEASLALIDTDADLFFGQHEDVIRRLAIHRGFIRTLSEPILQGTLVESQPLNISPCAAAGCANNLDDTQVVTVPGAEALSLHFSAFSTELDQNCFDGICDQVYLYNAAGDLFEILGGDLGSFDSKVIPGDTIQIRIVSDFGAPSSGYTIDRVDVISVCE